MKIMNWLVSTMLIAGIAGAVEAPDRINFPHDLHFENEVSCDTCHEAALTSTSVTDYLRPEMDICSDCHDIDDEEECALCHTNVDEAGDYERPPYAAGLFSHAAHGTAEIDCETCHGEPARPRPLLPTKVDCRDCHQTLADYEDCRMCHEPARDLLPSTHGPGWRSGHGLCARDDVDGCYLCHTRSTCDDCHSGDNVRPRSHDLNFRFNHGLEARGNEYRCATCHQEPTYCSSCHIAERVLPRDHSQVGWVGIDGGRHATEGLFDIENCIACHETGAAAPTCARCHTGD